MYEVKVLVFSFTVLLKRITLVPLEWRKAINGLILLQVRDINYTVWDLILRFWWQPKFNDSRESTTTSKTDRLAQCATDKF